MGLGGIALYRAHIGEVWRAHLWRILGSYRKKVSKGGGKEIRSRGYKKMGFVVVDDTLCGDEVYIQR